MYIGQATDIVVSGKRYTLQRYSRRLARNMAEWVAGRIGNPLAQLVTRLDHFPAHLQDALIDNAKQLTLDARTLWSSTFVSVWQSGPGRVHELYLLLTDKTADAESIFFEACLEHGDDYISQAVIKCIGLMPVSSEATELELLRQWGLLPAQPVIQSKPLDWPGIDRVLLKSFHLKPYDLDEMTLTEIFMLIDAVNEEARQAEQKPDINLTELERKVEWGKAQKQLTSHQHLKIALAQLEA